MLFNDSHYEIERQKVRGEIKNLLENYGSENIVLIVAELVKEEYQDLQFFVEEETPDFNRKSKNKSVAKGLDSAEKLDKLAYTLDNAFSVIHS